MFIAHDKRNGKLNNQLQGFVKKNNSFSGITTQSIKIRFTKYSKKCI